MYLTTIIVIFILSVILNMILIYQNLKLKSNRDFHELDCQITRDQLLKVEHKLEECNRKRLESIEVEQIEEVVEKPKPKGRSRKSTK